MPQIEDRLAERLRALPPGPMRAQVEHLLERVLDFADDCRCHESQGDGVPCGSVLTTCEGCPQCLEILGDLEARLPR